MSCPDTQTTVWVDGVLTSNALCYLGVRSLPQSWTSVEQACDAIPWTMLQTCSRRYLIFPDGGFILRFYHHVQACCSHGQICRRSVQSLLRNFSDHEVPQSKADYNTSMGVAVDGNALV
jgi:hypothetical protein